MHLATCFCVILNDAATDNFGFNKFCFLGKYIQLEALT